MDPRDNDEPSREELEDRVAELEQTVSKMLPDRRGVIKGLGAAALGGAAVGASTGGASGQSATGQVGTESGPVDVEGAQGNFDSVNTEGAVIGQKYYYASAYDGSDVDTRLDNAISAAGDGDVIYLEGGEYQTERTISNLYKFIGTNGRRFASAVTGGTEITGQWTLSNRITIMGVRVSGALTFDDVNCSLINSVFEANIQINSDIGAVLGCDGTKTVTFASGTSNGIVDSCTRLSVTDNGTNTVGDIA